AAGWGWFVDPIPGDDSEFVTPGDQGERGRMDLLTALEHELGHLLGGEHEDGSVMQETLTASTRRSVGPAAREVIFLGFGDGAAATWPGDSLLGRSGKLS